MKTLIWKDACTLVFTAVLFTRTKTWKQPKCQEIWMVKEDVVYIHKGIPHCHKKERKNAICSNMDGSRDYHIKWNKSDRKSQMPYDITHV